MRGISYISRIIIMPLAYIDDYQFGKIVINGEVIKKDVIILPSRIISDWWREEGHVLHISDLQEVLIAQPQVLIIGQGAHSRMRITTEVVNALRAARIEMISLDTGNACEEYNYRSKFSDVAAALHLTC
jgi:hypothetical protein